RSDDADAGEATDDDFTVVWIGTLHVAILRRGQLFRREQLARECLRSFAIERRLGAQRFARMPIGVHQHPSLRTHVVSLSKQSPLFLPKRKGEGQELGG